MAQINKISLAYMKSHPKLSEQTKIAMKERIDNKQLYKSSIYDLRQVCANERGRGIRPLERGLMER